jgi:hypothetical protein
MFDVHSFLLSIKPAASGGQRSACGGTPETYYTLNKQVNNFQ